MVDRVMKNVLQSRIRLFSLIKPLEFSHGKDFGIKLHLDDYNLHILHEEGIYSGKTIYDIQKVGTIIIRNSNADAKYLCFLDIEDNQKYIELRIYQKRPEIS